MIRGIETPSTFHGCSVALLRHDAARGVLVFDTLDSELAGALQGLEIGESEGLTGLSFVLQQPMRVADLQQDPAYSPRVDRRTGRACRSFLAVPVSSPRLGEWGMLTVASLDGVDTRLGSDCLQLAVDWSRRIVEAIERGS